MWAPKSRYLRDVYFSQVFVGIAQLKVRRRPVPERAATENSFQRL